MPVDTRELSETANVSAHVAAMDAVMKFAVEAIRWAILINGAAATAIVALLPDVKNAGLSLPPISSALIFFGWGTFLGATGFGFSYLAQVANLETADTDWRFHSPRALAVFVVIAAYVCFLIGAYSAASALQT
jgi:hypothetical protein